MCINLCSVCCCYSASLRNTSVTFSGCTSEHSGNPHFSYFLICFNAFDCSKDNSWHFSSDLRDVWSVYFMVCGEDVFHLFSLLQLLQIFKLLVTAALTYYISSCLSFIPVSTAEVWTLSVWDTNIELSLFVGKTSENGVIVVKLMMFALACRSIWGIM